MFDSIPDKIVIDLPESISFEPPYAYLLIWFLSILAFTFFLKFIKKAPHMKVGIAASVSILIVYLVCTLIYKFEPIGLQEYLPPLPFVELDQGSIRLVIYRMNDNGLLDFPYLCTQIISMLLLAFLVNVIYTSTLDKLKTPGWVVFRAVCTMFSIFVHYGVCRVLKKAFSMVPQDSIWELLLYFAPIALLGFLLGLFILAGFKGPMKYLFTEINPTFTGLAGFFFTSKVGSNISRAIWSTTVLTPFAFGLQRLAERLFESSAIAIGAFAHPGGLVVLICLLALWVLVGFKL